MAVAEVTVDYGEEADEDGDLQSPAGKAEAETDAAAEEPEEAATETASEDDDDDAAD
jgi:hypothetical protein